MTRKKKFLVGIGTALILVLLGWLYLWIQTHAYVVKVSEEILALEETLNQAFERMGENMITDAEARQLHLQVTTHFDTIHNHPTSVRVTGFTDEHHATFREMVERLEKLLVTHQESFLAFDTTTATTVDPSTFPFPDRGGAVATSVPPSMLTTTGTIAATVDTLESHLAYNVYCPAAWEDWEKAILCR